MRRRLTALFIICSLCQFLVQAQSSEGAARSRENSPVILIKAGRLVDVRAGQVRENQGILIEGERISEVGPLAEVQRRAPASARVIDLLSSFKPFSSAAGQPLRARVASNGHVEILGPGSCRPGEVSFE